MVCVIKFQMKKFNIWQEELHYFPLLIEKRNFMYSMPNVN
jgi:hypothetical protein